MLEDKKGIWQIKVKLKPPTRVSIWREASMSQTGNRYSCLDVFIFFSQESYIFSRKKNAMSDDLYRSLLQIGVFACQHIPVMIN